MILVAMSCESLPSTASLSRSDWPSSNCITKYGSSRCSPTSRTVTIRSLRRLADDFASRAKRAFASKLTDNEGCNVLMQTSRSSSGSSALNTSPMPPLAMNSRTRYLPIRPSSSADCGCESTRVKSSSLIARRGTSF